MKGELSVYPDATALARAAAAHFVDVSQAAIQLNRRFNVALSGGVTPQATYRLLATPEFSQQIDWKHVHLFWSDERCVAPDHPDSNYGMARAAFIAAVLIREDNIHRILGEHDPLVAAETYEQDLRDHFRSALPRFDLVLLGLGEDGHTASIFPGSAAAQETKRLALAVQHPQSNQWRVTATLPMINAAANVTFLVTGAGKAGSLWIVRSGISALDEFPASAVDPANGVLRWFCDSAAAPGS